MLIISTSQRKKVHLSFCLAVFIGVVCGLSNLLVTLAGLVLCLFESTRLQVLALICSICLEVNLELCLS